MARQPNDGLQYLQDYPRLRKWINQCVTCQALGYKPDMPLQIGPGAAAQNLRRYFKPMALNAMRLCEQCASTSQAERE